MRTRELFRIGGISQSLGELDYDNCQIESKSKGEGNETITLHLKRTSDGKEAHVRLKVRPEFGAIATQLTNWALKFPEIVGLTLNQLNDFETGLTVGKSGGRLSIR